jgi:hypothetical protein
MVHTCQASRHAARRRKQEDHIASRRAAWTESLLARWQVTQKQAWFSSHEKGNPGPALLILHPRRRFGAGFFGDLAAIFWILQRLASSTSKPCPIDSTQQKMYYTT